MARHQAALALIIGTYLVLGGLYAALTPPWQAPDEPAHYNYVRVLAQEGSLPELHSGCYDQDYLNLLITHRFAPEVSAFSIHPLCYENHQPPLYYALAAPLFSATGGVLLPLRLFSVVLGAVLLGLAYNIVRTLFPGDAYPGGHRSLALATTALVAFVPMHLSMMAAVNNDALAEVLLAAVALLLMRQLVGEHSPSLRRWLVIGVLMGLALITKLTAYIVLPLGLLALWLDKRSLGTSISRLAAMFLPAGLIAFPWFVRNAGLYGGWDVLGLGRHDEVVVGQLRAAEAVAQVGLPAYVLEMVAVTFRSFWGQFGWMAVPMDPRVYVLLGLMTVVALGGLVQWRRTCWSRLSRPQKHGLYLLATVVLLTGLAYLWYNLSFKQFQGRYLFPALIPISLFLTLGLRQALSREGALLGAAVSFAVGVVAFGALLAGEWVGKWALLFAGLLAFGFGIRSRLTSLPSTWLLAIPCIFLALLSAASLWWFIVPHLSP